MLKDYAINTTIKDGLLVSLSVTRKTGAVFLHGNTAQLQLYNTLAHFKVDIIFVMKVFNTFALL